VRKDRRRAPVREKTAEAPPLVGVAGANATPRIDGGRGKDADLA
jgi:hypothetical protein